MVIMVDEDVDPFNLPQVMWALSSKVNPAGDLVQFAEHVGPLNLTQAPARQALPTN
ncbi:hydroxyaromatic non-oxidative decarboxylase protein C [Klebsiella pneumoniae]|uniref:Hydroxyaromatic non-oxidative decarboxylase protein C n=1 Tax=Klebsiella pneumoniae TaxID=573 RepID=A0A447RPL9_KLEPN|nr:hydroxyaromatic non-oxidative decarboxylase protein C [Klebsiella pneumoniae]